MVGEIEIVFSSKYGELDAVALMAGCLLARRRERHKFELHASDKRVGVIVERWYLPENVYEQADALFDGGYHFGNTAHAVGIAD